MCTVASIMVGEHVMSWVADRGGMSHSIRLLWFIYPVLNFSVHNMTSELNTVKILYWKCFIGLFSHHLSVSQKPVPMISLHKSFNISISNEDNCTILDVFLN